VFGISSGNAADKEKFIKANKLNNLELLIDSDNAVRTLFKVPKAAFGLLPGRVTYVVGKDGNIKSIFDDLARAEIHPDQALANL
jgi:peroxiredoxin Q/BCP